MSRALALFWLSLGLAACASTPQSVPPLASARVVGDFDSYTLQRVGIVPVSGGDLPNNEALELQAALLAEFSAGTDFELVALAGEDLAETPPLEPYRRGWYSPRTILTLARRHRLDGLLIATVTDRQVYHPQRLGLQVDLVSAETGQTLWYSALHIDAAESRVRDSMGVWARETLGDVSEASWESMLMSPRRFARFAAHQVASLL
jgi:hypothetical protein